MTNCGLSPQRLFVDASWLLLLVATAFALRRHSTKTPPKADELYGPTSVHDRRSTLLMSLGLLGWGVLGLVLGFDEPCPGIEWLAVLCTSIAAGSLLTGTWIGVKEVVLASGFNLLTLLVCLRCSCCSRLTKRALLLPPLALLAVLNGVNWLEARVLGRCPEVFPPHVFFAGATSIFLAMFLATLTAVGLSMLPRSRRVTTGRVDKLLVALSLAGFALTSIIWAVVGLQNLPRRDIVVQDNCWGDEDDAYAASWSIAELLAVGVLLLLTTSCCRLENFFLAPNEPAEVDEATLSTKFTAAKSPSAPKPSETRTPRGAAAMV